MAIPLICISISIYNYKKLDETPQTISNAGINVNIEKNVNRKLRMENGLLKQLGLIWWTKANKMYPINSICEISLNNIEVWHYTHTKRTTLLQRDNNKWYIIHDMIYLIMDTGLC